MVLPLGGRKPGIPAVGTLTESIADTLYPAKAATEAALDRVDPGSAGTELQALTQGASSPVWTSLPTSPPMLPLRRHMAVLGDSMASSDSANDREVWGWANLLSHGGIIRCGNGWSAGVGGNTTTQMLARITDVTGLTPKPTLCIVQGGTNDVGGAVPLATTKSNLSAIYAALRAADIEPVAVLIPPKDADAAAVIALNAWISAYAFLNRIACLDNWTPNADPDGTWKTGYSDDGVHPVPATARRIGDRVAATLASPRGIAQYLTTSSADPDNLIVNGTFEGDTNADGVANNWTLNTPGAHVTPSLVAGTGDVVGNWQQIVKTSSGNNYITPGAAITTGFTVGDTLLFCGRIRLAPAGGFGLDARIHDAPSVVVDNILSQWESAIPEDDGAVFSHLFVVPSGVTSFSPRVIGSGSVGTATWAVAQLALRNLTAMGIA